MNSNNYSCGMQIYIMLYIFIYCHFIGTHCGLDQAVSDPRQIACYKHSCYVVEFLVELG